MALDLEAKMRTELVRYLVQKAIFCPGTGEVMDVRTCVVLVDSDGDPAGVLSQGGWAMLGDQQREVLRLRGYTVDEATVRP